MGGEQGDYALAVAKEMSIEKESLPEYIAKKREMFLVQYSLGVKRDEMRKLEQIALAEEKKLEAAEKFLGQFNSGPSHFRPTVFHSKHSPPPKKNTVISAPKAVSFEMTAFGAEMTGFWSGND